MCIRDRYFPLTNITMSAVGVVMFLWLKQINPRLVLALVLVALIEGFSASRAQEQHHQINAIEHNKQLPRK